MRRTQEERNMLPFIVKRMLPAVKAHAAQEYEADRQRPHGGMLRMLKMRDGMEAESLFFAAARPHAPLVIDIYGGGYIGGNVYKQAPLCARYRDTLQLNAAAVSYRYGPDCSYPASAQDLYDAICCLIDDAALDFDREQIILEGHSAGAHLAVSTLLYAQTQKRQLPIRAMVLDYPLFDVRQKSLRALPKTKYAVSGMVLDMMYHGYFKNEANASQSMASPILAADAALRALPPMYINTCEYDSLKYSAQAFMERLDSLGIAYTNREVAGAVHGYVETCSFGSMQESKEYPEPVKQAQYARYEQTFADFCAYIKSKTG